MEITINEKIFEIDDCEKLNISFTANLKKLSVNRESNSQTIMRDNKVIIEGENIIYLKSGDINSGFISENGGSTSMMTTFQKGIMINIEGDVNHVETENGSISINGEAKNIKTYNGSVKTTGNVIGNIETYNGSVKVLGNVSGNVKTHNGSIRTTES